MPDTLLSMSEAARRLGVSSSRVRQWVGAGRLPAVHFGRYRAIRAEDVAAFGLLERKTGWPRGKPRTKKNLLFCEEISDTVSQT